MTVPFPLWRETYLAETVTDILVLNLGDLRISNQEESRAVLAKEMQKFAQISSHFAPDLKSNKAFDEINISLSSINLVYYSQNINHSSSLNYLSSMTNIRNRSSFMNIEREKTNFQEGFTIIENFSLNVNISKLKRKPSFEQAHPQIKVSGKIYDISINLSAKTYELLQILAQRENDSKAKGFKRELKDRITKNATLKGYLSHQNTTNKNWKKYFAVISGPYIYLYHNENTLTSSFVLGINGCKVTPIIEGKQKNSFSVSIFLPVLR